MERPEEERPGDPDQPRTTAVTPRTTPPILVSVEGMEHEGSRPSNNPIVAEARISWIWNGIRWEHRA